MVEWQIVKSHKASLVDPVLNAVVGRGFPFWSDACVLRRISIVTHFFIS
jgi:hypothetical protein